MEALKLKFPLNKIDFASDKINKNVYAFASFFLPLLLYYLTAARTITSYADSAELITAASNLNAAHPPGYPLYILLGRLFALLPTGSMAFRVNLLSCFLGALTVYFVYKTFHKVGFAPLSSFLASQIIAFSYSFWLYSLTAEVYSLNSFFAALIIYLTILWGEKSKLNENKTADRILWLLAFVSGLAFSNHTSIILLVPGLFFLVWAVDKTVIFTKIAKLILFFGLGLIPYVLVFFFAKTPHYPLFGNLPTLSRFWAYITRADYGGFFSAGPANNPVASGIQELIFYYLGLLFSRFTFLAPVIAFYFVLASFLRKQVVFISLSVIFLTTALFFPLFALRGASAADFHSQGVIERFALLGFLILGMVFLFGLHWLITDFKPKKANLIFSFISLPLALYLLISNYPNVNKKNYLLAKNYALNIITQVEPNSLIFTTDDMTLFSLFYFVNAEKVKPDIILINANFLDSVDYQKELLVSWPDLYETASPYSYDVARDIIKLNQGVRPIYFVMLKDPYPYGFDGNPYYFSPMGLVLRADTSVNPKKLENNSLRNYWHTYDLSGLDKEYQDPFAQQAKQNYAFRAEVNAKIYYKSGCLTCAQADISFLSTVSSDPSKLKETLASLPSTKPQTANKTAQELLASAKEWISQDTGGDLTYFHRAVWDLEQAISLEPANYEANSLLSGLFKSIGLTQLASQYDKLPRPTTSP